MKLTEPRIRLERRRAAYAEQALAEQVIDLATIGSRFDAARSWPRSCPHFRTCRR